MSIDDFLIASILFHFSENIISPVPDRCEIIGFGKTYVCRKSLDRHTFPDKQR